MINEINNVLKRIEHENNVRILYATESGSRSWGFANQVEKERYFDNLILDNLYRDTLREVWTKVAYL